MRNVVTKIVVGEELYLSLEHYKGLISLEGSDANTLVRMMGSLRAFVGGILFKEKPAVPYKFNLDIASAKNKLDTIPFLHLVDMFVSKPEGFEGYFSDYGSLLKVLAKDAFSDAVRVINEADKTIASAVNDTDLSTRPFSKNMVLKELSKKRELSINDIRAYFPVANNVSKTTLGKVTKNMKDVYETIAIAEAIKDLTSTFDTDTITARVKELNDKTLALHERIRHKEIVSISRSAILELSDAIYAAGKQVEYYTLIVTYTITYLKAIEHLIEDLKKF